MTSATPYDPPLTYGGWLQSRSLGSRIASLLQKREAECETQDCTPTDGSDADSTKGDGIEETGSTRKHKIIIHSSPFIRCVQTAVAISAGIGQFRASTVVETYRPPVLHSGSPLVRASNASPRLTAIPEPEHLHMSSLNRGNPPLTKHRIAQLRIDAFLGEWLSPDYFEDTTPPPGSVLMVASAKAELLRLASETATVANSRKSSLGNFPGGWSRDRSPASSADEDERTGLAQTTKLSHSLPRRMNTISQGSGSRIGLRPDSHDTTLAALDGCDDHLTYVPPTPAYAISNSDPIPEGYVAHAQNACVDVQYQWDSMRPPQDWGNGGEYGEEWSSMHKRFRNGLQRMIAWYEEHGTSVGVQDGSSEDDDSDADTVLILVTHGAGCNALIGALTNQPVLLDVGMASLTMAARKPESEDAKPTISQLPKQARRGSIDLGIADAYTVVLTASTEHLRAPSNPLGMPSPRLDAPFFGANRRPSASPFLEAPASSIVKSGFAGGLHRSASGSHGLRPYPITLRSKLSSGLWGSETTSSHGGVSESSSSDSLPNFDGVSTLRKNHAGDTDATGRDAPASQAPAPADATTVQRGLWDGRAENSPKRRWTSADH